MAEWKKFVNSKEQIMEMNDAKHGVLLRKRNSFEQQIIFSIPVANWFVHEVEEYFICNPNPHAEMIHRWADTGQPVYLFDEYEDKWELTTAPCWNPNTKYSFNPPKEKQFIEVRDYLLKTLNGEIFKATANKKFNEIKYIEDMNNFVRWLDDDWRKVEI